MIKTIISLAIAVSIVCCIACTSTHKTESAVNAHSLTYPIVDTDTTDFYSDTSIIEEPKPSEAFYGQDTGYAPSYTDNNDGTISDNVTGLMWQKTMDAKMSYDNAVQYANDSNLGGYDDWRFPTIKELYSLIIYSGSSMGINLGDDLYINTKYFDQPVGDVSKGERPIDAQTWSSTEYVGLTMKGDATVFGVNFVDGRIKGYNKFMTLPPRDMEGGMSNQEATRRALNPDEPNKMYVRLVRGNPDYGINNFVDNNDGTITDLATGLMWQKATVLQDTIGKNL